MFKSIFLLSAAVLLGFSSCQKDNEYVTLDTALPAGNWKITYFADSYGVDESVTYNQYEFEFNGDGTVVGDPMHPNNPAENGSWYTSLDANGDVNFHLQFINQDRWAYLVADWDVIEQTSDLVRLQTTRNRGNNGNISYLTFEKE
jgi:hypothetical protein